MHRLTKKIGRSTTEEEDDFYYYIEPVENICARNATSEEISFAN